MNKSKPRKAGISSTKNPENIHRTAKNKIRRILKALRFAGGGQVEVLKERLKFWESK